MKWKDFAAVGAIVLLLPYVTVLFLGEELPGQTDAAGQESRAEESGWRIRYVHDGVAEDMDPEDYVMGAAFAVLPKWAQEEMMKAQIVLVRTNVYRAAQMQQESGQMEAEEIVPAQLLPEAYEELDARRESMGEEFFPFYNRYLEAWNDVAGCVLAADGSLAEGAYHLVSAGMTRDAEPVIGDGYPYLLSTECPNDFKSSDYLFRKEFSIQEWEDLLEAAGAEEPGGRIEILRRDDAGYVLSICIGEEIWGGEQFRAALGLRSSNFTMEQGEDKVAVITKGVGHGLGMSQYGANEMAKEGKSWEEILSCYFPGTQVENCE